MKALLTDPVVLICVGIIIVGIIALFWAIGKFRSMKSLPRSPGGMNDDLLPSSPDLRDIDFRAPSLSVQAPSATVSKDVADRLESMTQRLAEMQAVLTKQSSNAPGQAGAAGGVGQGFSPETIDKLLKIIGNVIQQVDILQKSVNGPKDASTVKPSIPESPFTKI